MKWIKKIVLFLVVSAAFVVGGSWAILHFYGDEVEQMALERINKQLTAKVDVADVEISLWDQFPLASLHFTQLKVSHPLLPDSVIARADDMHLAFSIADFIDGDYRVQKLALNEADLFLHVNEKGKANYIIWKQDTLESESSFGFDLEALSLKNTWVSYSDETSDFATHCFVEEAQASGGLEDDLLSMEVDLLGKSETLNVDKFNYLAKKNIDIQTELEIDLAKQTGKINNTKAKINNTQLTGSGTYALLEGTTRCDFVVEGEDQAITEVISILPWSWKTKVKDWQFDGEGDLAMRVNGLAGKGNIPQIEIDLETGDLAVTDLTSKRQVHGMEGKATWFFAKDKNDLQLSNWSAKTDEGAFTLSGNILNLIHPSINLKPQGSLALSDFTSHEALADMDRLEGDCEFDLHFKGNFAGWDKITKAELNKAVITGTVDLSDGAIKWKANPEAFEDLQVSLLWKDNDAAIESLTGNLGSTEFELEGFLRNIAPFILLDNQRLAIDAKLKSEKLWLDELLHDNSAQVSTIEGDESPYEMKFPDALDMEFQLDVGEVAFRDFSATDLKGVCKLQRGKLHINPVTFGLAEGSFKADLTLDNSSQKHFDISCQADLNAIDISVFFEQFENFGQEFIRSDHLRGLANAQVTFEAIMDSHLDFDQKSIASEIDIDIKNGELIKHESMADMVDYLRENKLAGLVVDINELENSLEHIKFAHLSNQISIRDEVIYIPDMHIESTAMDMNASGTHTFANVVDFNIDFQLRQIMKDKSQTEFGVVEDDGLGQRIFISMNGPAEDPNFGYDNLAARDKRKQKIAEEKANFKQLVKSTFNKDERATVAQKQRVKPDTDVSVSVDLFGENSGDQKASKGAENTKASKGGTSPNASKSTTQEEKPKGLKGLFGKKDKGKKNKAPSWEEDDDF